MRAYRSRRIFSLVTCSTTHAGRCQAIFFIETGINFGYEALTVGRLMAPGLVIFSFIRRLMTPPLIISFNSSFKIFAFVGFSQTVFLEQEIGHEAATSTFSLARFDEGMEFGGVGRRDCKYLTQLPGEYGQSRP